MAQEIILKKGHQRSAITKGMYIDFQAGSSDSIVKDWRNIKCLCQDERISEKLWLVDSVSEHLIAVKQPVHWKVDTLSGIKYKKRDIKRMSHLGWTYRGNYEDETGETNYIMVKPDQYHLQVLHLDTITSLRFSKNQNCTGDLGYTPFVMLGATALNVGGGDNGAYADPKLRVLISLSNLIMATFSIDWIKSGKVRTYKLSEWTTEFKA